MLEVAQAGQLDLPGHPALADRDRDRRREDHIDVDGHLLFRTGIEGLRRCRRGDGLEHQVGTVLAIGQSVGLVDLEPHRLGFSRGQVHLFRTEEQEIADGDFAFLPGPLLNLAVLVHGHFLHFDPVG